MRRRYAEREAERQALRRPPATPAITPDLAHLRRELALTDLVLDRLPEAGYLEAAAGELAARLPAGSVEQQLAGHLAAGLWALVFDVVRDCLDLAGQEAP